MTDLDIRIAALQAEYNEQLSAISNRAATMAAELASAQAKLKAAEAKIAELTEKKRKKAEANG